MPLMLSVSLIMAFMLASASIASRIISRSRSLNRCAVIMNSGKSRACYINVSRHSKLTITPKTATTCIACVIILLLCC